MRMRKIIVFFWYVFVALSSAGGVPSGDREQCSRAFSELLGHSALPLFENLAQKAGVDREVLEHATLESFLFRKKGFPTGGEQGAKTFRMGMGHFGERRKVVLATPFEMQATPVTQFQWFLVMGDNPSFFTKEGTVLSIGDRQVLVDLNRPVENVSWEEAQQFLRRLNELQNRHRYGLPSDEEWEFAARGGTDTHYPFGDKEYELEDYAWFAENSGGVTHPVAFFPPNSFGLYDTAGNVWEWTSFVGRSLPIHSFRGGSWNSSEWFLRTAYRHPIFPHHKAPNVGLRLMRTSR